MPSLDKHRKQRVQDDEMEDGDSDTGERNDAILTKVDPEYLNKPIDLKQGDAKLRALVANLKVVEKQLKNVAEKLSEVAAETADMLSEQYINEEFDEDKMLQVVREDDSLAGLNGELRAALDRLKENEIRMAVISEIRGRIVGGHQISDINKLYEGKVAEPLQKFRSQTTRQRFLKHREYRAHLEVLWENLTSGAGVPNVKRFIPREDDDEEDSDEEIEIGAQQGNFVCPITLAAFEDPYTSTICPHSFSGDAIKEMVKQNGGKVKCPVAGCPKTLTLAQLEPDAGLARRTEAHQRRVKEGRTQATQGAGRTYETMDLSDDD
ncbi:hypothetical protein JCM10213_005400 [Rhodosporidiobolus nylandii]